MQRQLTFLALAASTAATVFLFSSCSTVETRIAEVPGAYHSMSAADQTLVTHGRIREGMSQDAVYIAWGPPSQRGGGRYRRKAVETWIYYDTSVGDYYPGAFGYGPYAGFGYGYGYGGGFGYHRHYGRHYGRYYGPYAYDPFFDPYFYNRVAVLRYPERTVSFESGRVIGYQFFPKPYVY